MFAAEPPQEPLPYGRWGDALGEHFAQAARDIETDEDIGDAEEISCFPERTWAGRIYVPATAPTSLSFGVVLFSYAGAQAAPEASRSKDDAKQRAASVIEDAKRDFKAAVSKCDRGSTADAGRIPRGVLEPAVEYALFSLEKGAVHPEPVDTPRGYWVLRRND